jgi:hypothetical protein
VLKEETVSWALDKSYQFTTKSLYRFRTDGVITKNIHGIIWKCRVPVKITIFLCQLYNRKIQVAMEMRKRGWKGGGSCSLCGENKTVEHIFGHCILAKYMCCIYLVFSGPPSISMEDFFWNWVILQAKGDQNLFLFMFTRLFWAMWYNQNSMAIKKWFPKSPHEILYNAISFLQKWNSFLKQKDQEKARCWIRSLKNWRCNSHPALGEVSDIGVI